MDPLRFSSDEDDDVMLPSKPSFEMNLNKPSEEAISLTNSLKRGLKLKDQSDTLSLSGALKKGFRRHILKSTDSALSVVAGESYYMSSRNSGKFRFKSPKKLQKNGTYDNSGNLKLSKHSVRDSKSDRVSGNLRLGEVMPPFHDDTMSMIEGLLVDTAPIRYEGQ